MPAVVVVTPQAQHVAHAGGLSDGALVAVAVAALVVLLCLLWSIARIFAIEPRWTLSLRHSLGEAAFRASATWDEFSDWARLGH
jgi:hypothetical protein